MKVLINTRRSMGRHGDRQRGFTLVELLVVIAIIALLVSILMPALSQAKQLVQRSVCMSHMNTAGRGLMIYTNENDGWLPGPNTSGRHLVERAGGNAGVAMLDEETRRSEPFQATDWISPTLGDDLGLPRNTADRLREALSTKLKCPSNDLMYNDAYLDVIDYNDIPYASYAATFQFTWWDEADGGVMYGDDGMGFGAGVARLPDGYRPRIEDVGKASDKAYIVEGTRYVEGDLSTISISDNLSPENGGSMMVQGLIAPSAHDPHRFNPMANPRVYTKANKEAAWRHLDDSMNLCFFDGHCESASLEESLRYEWFFPSETEIVNDFLMQLPPGEEVPNGTIVP